MDGCAEGLKQRYTFGDYLFYTGQLAVPLLTAGLAIGRQTWLGLIGYVLLCAGGVALVLKFYCSRCPHYTREETSLRCIFFWNLPKFFAPRPGALDKTDKLVLWVAPLALLGIPFVWLVHEPGLLAIYTLSTVIFAAAVRRHECHRCIYFACPLNQVPEAQRNGPGPI